MPRPKKPKAPTKVEALKHNDERANIPTAELQDFVRKDEQDHQPPSSCHFPLRPPPPIPYPETSLPRRRTPIRSEMHLNKRTSYLS